MTQYLNTERVAEILCISKESARKFMREMPHICIGGKAHEMASAVREQYLTPTQPKDE